MAAEPPPAFATGTAALPEQWQPAPIPDSRPKRRMPRGPLITLAAGLVLAVVLGALSANAATDEADRRAAAADQAVAVEPTPTPVEPAPAAAESAEPEQSSGPEQPPATTAAPPEKFRAAYAGQIKGGAGSIAIAIRDGGAVAYLCDGKRLEAWLLGTASGGQLNLSGPKNASLTGSYDKDSAAGSVTAGGRTWKLDVPVAKKPSGLYRSTAQVRGARVVAGWIVLPGGDQVGMVNTGGVETPAPPLDLNSTSATVNGVAMTAAPIDGTSENGF